MIKVFTGIEMRIPLTPTWTVFDMLKTYLMDILIAF